MVTKSISSPTRWRLTLVAALLCCLAGFVLPLPTGCTRSGAVVLGIFAAVLLLWILEAIDWPCLLGLAGLSLIPELGPQKVWAHSFGSPTVAFLLFTFACTYALARTPFLRRCACWSLRTRWAKGSRRGFFIAYLSTVGVLGLFLSPTILFVVFLALHQEVCTLLDLSPSDPLPSTLLMGQVVVCALSSGMTPFAHVFPILAIGFGRQLANLNLTAVDYLLVAMPTGLLAFVGVLTLGLWRLRFKGGAASLRTPLQRMDEAKRMSQAQENRAEKAPKWFDSPGPWTQAEKWAGLVFAAVVLLWLLPDLLRFFSLPGAETLQSWGTSLPPLLGAGILSLFRTEEGPLLPFKETATKGIAWGSLLMAATTLAFGFALTTESLGIGMAIRSAFGQLTVNLPAFLLLLVLLLWAGIQTNLSSNIVTVSLLSLVALPLALARGSGAFSPAVVVCALGLLSSCSFAAPPAHPNVALAVGSPWVRAGEMLRFGAVAVFMVILSFVAVGLPLALTLLN